MAEGSRQARAFRDGGEEASSRLVSLVEAESARVERKGRLRTRRFGQSLRDLVGPIVGEILSADEQMSDPNRADVGIDPAIGVLRNRPAAVDRTVPGLELWQRIAVLEQRNGQPRGAGQIAYGHADDRIG